MGRTHYTRPKERPGDKTMPDDSIVQLYWDRNERAIAVTDVKYGNFLYTIAYNIIHSEPDCDECLNDTYLGIWNRIPPHRPTAFQAFISRIMRNIAINRYKHSKAGKRVPSELLVSLDELEHCMHTAPTTADEQAVKALADALNGFLETLSERDELIFVCRYYYADKISQIAGMLKISENTVLRVLARVREGLKAYLIKEGVWDA